MNTDEWNYLRKEPPIEVLPDMESVRDAVARKRGDRIGLNGTAWDGVRGMHAHRVRSEWLISLIEEIVSGGKYPYNATVKQLASDRLGLGLTDAEVHREGDTLSLLVYNAQCYRHHDKAVLKNAAENAAGWFHPTTEWLAAHVGERVEVLGVEGLARVAIGPCIRPPRTRNKVYRIEGPFKIRVPVK